MAHATLGSIINPQRLGHSPSHGWWVLHYPFPPVPANFLHAALQCFLLYTHHHSSNLIELYTNKTVFLYLGSTGTNNPGRKKQTW